MKPSFNHLSRLSQLTLAAVTLSTGIALATPISWSGGGADALWSTTGNWTGGVVPGGADDVTVGSTYTSGTTITVGGTAGSPTQINSLAFDTGTSGGNKFLASGYLQINTGNVTTTGNQAGWLNAAVYIPGTGTSVNNWSVGAGGTLRVRGNIAVIGGSGTPTITATGATGSLNLDNATQSYAGNWDISTQSLTVKSFGSGAVKVSNVKWYTSNATSNTYSNNLTFGGFARISTGSTQTLTFNGGWTGTASDILFNTDGGGTSTGATIKLAGTPTSFTASTFQVIGTLQLDSAGYLAGVGAVALNRGSASTYGIVNWNAAETVAATTTFNNTQASAAAQLGMLATGTTTINGLYKLNSSATVTDGSDLTINTAVSGATLALAGKVTDSASTTIRALTKIGAGTAILSANTNDYRGGTTVSAGTLLANNTSGSATGTGAVAVSGSGAVLGGTGRIAPTGIAGISVSTGAFIAPGASIGTLTVDLSGTTGTIASASGAGFQFELGTANLTIGSIAGGSSDLLALAGAAAADFAFNGNNVDFLNTGAVGYYKLFSTSLADASTWTGLTFDGTTGVVSSGLTYSNLASGPTSGEFIVGTSSNGGAVGDIYFRAIPEPAAALLGGLGMLTLLRRRRA